MSWGHGWLTARRLILAAILLLAAYVRLSHLDLGPFMLDQARDSARALAIVRGQTFPLVGPEVDGGPAHTWGPLYFVLLAIPFAFWPEPVWAAAFLACLNLVAVYLTYRLGAALFSRDVGLVAAALLAADPGMVASARLMWNLSPLPLFILAFFWGLFALVVQRRSSMIVLSAGALACLVQLHLSTLSLAVVLTLAVLIYRPPVRRRDAMAAIAMAAILLLPFLVGQVLSGFSELRAVLSYSHGRVGLRSPLDLLLLARRTFFASAELSTQVAAGLGDGAFARAFAVLQRVNAWVVTVSTLLLLARIVACWWRGKPPWSLSMARYVLLALWIWVPIAVLSLKSDRLPWYYFDLLYPAPFLAVALALIDVGHLAPLRARPPWARGVRRAVAVLVALLVIVQADFTRRWWTVTAVSGAMPVPLGIGVEARRQAPTVHLMPMRYKRALMASLADRVDGDPAAIHRRAHGILFQDLLEDKGFFFNWLSGGAKNRGAHRDARPHHYALLGPADDDGGVDAPRAPGAGPYSVLEYLPQLDYGAWQYAYAAAGPDWTALPLPTRGIPDLGIQAYPPLFAWRQLPVFVRGEIVADPPSSSFRLIVVLREPHGGGHHQIDTVSLNGAPVPVAEVIAHPTFIARDSETIIDLGARLRPGRNTVSFRISGDGRHFDLDVYERRP